MQMKRQEPLTITKDLIEGHTIILNGAISQMLSLNKGFLASKPTTNRQNNDQNQDN